MPLFCSGGRGDGGGGGGGGCEGGSYLRKIQPKVCNLSVVILLAFSVVIVKPPSTGIQVIQCAAARFRIV
jgi:hypothetical protein